jgi:predicted  nucleic acid-binding Zn-ribbon protein
MKRALKLIIVLVIIGVAVYFFRDKLDGFSRRIEEQLSPCSSPIAYSIGTFDPRFGIAKNDFLVAASKAEKIWEDPTGKNLFEYAPDGNLKINLVYDSRQEATDKLKTLGITVGNNKSSYDELKSKYDAMRADYEKQKSAFDTRVKEFQKRESAYEETVKDWNKRGGAPRVVYNQLTAEKEWLATEATTIKALQEKLKVEIADINAFVVVLNRLVAELNLNVNKFNEIGQANGAEFEEGVYKSDASGEEIDIYQFDTNARLVRVLAHELGHALGLQHVSDPKAIMYQLNESTNEKITVDDLVALKARCRL